MKRYIILTLGLIIVLTIIGCGGGKSTPVATGSITGTISVTSASPSSSAVAVSSISATKFVKVRPRTSATAQSVSNERIIKFKEGTSAAEAAQIITGLGGTLKKKIYGTDATYVMTVNIKTFSKSNALNNGKVESIGNNRKMYALATPNDTYYNSPYSYNWNYTMMNMEQAWDVQKGSSSVVVAVIDTGVAPEHPDLKENLVTELVTGLVKGYDFIDDDSEPWDTTYLNEDNQYSHGTHVAGIISAVTNNNTGVAGIAWNVKIMPIRVLGNDGYGNEADIAAGINWAVDHGANIINLSLGGSGSPTDPDSGIVAIVDAIDYAIAHNVTVVAAAGNSAGAVCFPANYEPVIAVSALDKNGVLASYSCYGPEIDIAAPGGDSGEDMNSYICNITYDKKTSTNTYIGMGGTSMASPHIAGLAALLYSQGITHPTAITSAIKNTATSMGDTSKYGAGRADAYAALTGSRSVAKVFYYNVADTSSHSSFYSVSTNGAYTIASVKPGNYKVCAFIDNDGNGEISSGDMVGISDTLTVTIGNTSTANLTMTKVTDTSGISVTNYFKKLL